MKEKSQKIVEFRKSGTRNILIRALFSLLFASLLFFIVFSIEVFGPLKLRFPLERFRILSDSFFVPGIVLISFWLMVFLFELGAFDLLSYSVKKVWVIMFRSASKKSDFPSYYEYVLKRKKNAKPIHYELVSIGVISLFLGILFAYLSLSNNGVSPSNLCLLMDFSFFSR